MTRQGKRILIIDDEELVRKTLSKSPQHLGAIPLTAADGDQGIALILETQREGTPVDAVILDLTITDLEAALDIALEKQEMDA